MAQPVIPGLAELREQIDAVDSQLLELLNRRARLSLAVGRAKADVPGAKIFDPVREAQLLEKLASRNEGPLTGSHVASIWRAVMSASRALQKPSTAACLGPEGTFSHFAAADFLGESARLELCRDFDEVFRRVSLGACTMGVIPLENSIHGTVTQSFDLFSRYAVRIQAEFYSRIANSLLSRESNLVDIRTVYSHPQPLGQCELWLRAHLPHARLVSAASTASAAWLASQEEGAASIGHRSMAEKAGMNVLAGNIQDDSSNWTRFVVITAEEAGARPALHPGKGREGMRSSLLFTVANHAGSLSAVLDVFSRHGINMTKLESRPMKGANWNYVFFADVECDLDAEALAPMLEELKELCSLVRVLGCYPEGPHLDHTADTTGC